MNAKNKSLFYNCENNFVSQNVLRFSLRQGWGKEELVVHLTQHKTQGWGKGELVT